MANHRVPINVFRSVSAGDADETDTLRRGQVSKRRLLLYAVQRRIESDHPALFAAGDFAANWAALGDALRAQPSAVERVLLYPTVGAWGMRLLRRLQQTAALTEDDTDDAGYLGGVVAVALAAAGRPGEVRVRVRADGTLSLPGWGRFGSLGKARWLTAEVHADATTARLLEDGAIVAGTQWSPTRRLHSVAGGEQIEVLLDDVDPFRSADQLPAEDRLPDDAVAQWQNQVDEAWGLLVEHHPRRAAALSRDVVMMTPLRAKEMGASSSSESFGGIALTPPRHGFGLAETLVHEHQHIKLWALLSLVPLIDLRDERLHYAPWRLDPRPARGLLQGAYAYLGLVQFWEIERRRRNDALTHFEFARWRIAVREVVEVLVRSGSLTDAGHHFVSGMILSLEPLLTTPVPALPAELAEDAAAENRIAWRLRNLRVAPDVLRALTLAWHNGQSCPPIAAQRSEPSPGRRGSWSTGRLRLAHERLRAGGERAVPGATPADVAYARGDDLTAAALYSEAIRSPADPLDAWVGLALIHRRLRSPADLALTGRPELVHALWRTIGPAEAGPKQLAEWVAEGLHPGRLDH